MKQYLIPSAVAAAVAGFVSFAMHAPDHKSARAPQTAARSYIWPELTQKQVDDMTMALSAIPKREVAIYCLHACSDLALSFDNAFESAHWSSGVETPLVDTNVGLNVGPKDDEEAKALAGIIAHTTGLNVELIDAANLENRLVIAIGRKPR